MNFFYFILFSLSADFLQMILEHSALAANALIGLFAKFFLSYLPWK